MALAALSMGGHFPAFLSHTGKLPNGRVGFESARSALYALLLEVKPRRIYVPNYICEAVTQAIRKAGVDIEVYALLDFGYADWPRDIAPDELLLVVDYFGLSSDLVKSALASAPPRQTIVDCSQAYFSSYPEAFAQIYSPRKFLPVPDGGLIETSCELRSASCNNEASILHYQYLLRRCIGEPEETRGEYLRAEQRLDDINTNEISDFTKNLILSLDENLVKARRRNNFTNLAELDCLNDLSLSIKNQVPLCYPLMMSGAADIREELLSRRIFTPKYWPNIKPMSDFESRILNDTVFLTIDHRYDASAMNGLKSLIINMN